MESCYIVLSLLAVVCLTVHSAAAGQCMFEYTFQPPSTTLQNCNPYDQNEVIRIVLECIVRYQTNEFEIQWFRENTTGALEDLGRGNPVGLLGSDDWFSRYHVHNFIYQQYNPSYLGKYWCQVINTTADLGQPLVRSNVFTLLAPENYTQPTCYNQSTTVQTVDNLTCADLSVHSEPPQTTLPAPTTTLSLHVSVSNHKPTCRHAQLSACTTIANSATTLSILKTITDIDPTTTTVSLQTPHLSVAVTDPTTTSSAVSSSEMQSTVLAAGASTVALLLVIIISSLLIVILLVQRRKKRTKYLVNGHNNGYSNNITQQNLETTESVLSHEPVAYEVPVVSTKKQQPQPDAQYSVVVKPVNKAKNGDAFCISTDGGTPSTLDNPVYMTGCAAAAGGLDHQYSSLNHQVLPAPTHDDQCSEEQHSSTQRDASTAAAADSDDQYSKLKIDIYNSDDECN